MPASSTVATSQKKMLWKAKPCKSKVTLWGTMMTDKKGAQEETGRHVPLTSETKLAAL